jgi:hypothetical protein
MPTEHFRDKRAYLRNLAYRHANNIPFTASRVVVGGRSHRVDHSRDTPARRRINAAQRRKVARRGRRRESRR